MDGQLYSGINGRRDRRMDEIQREEGREGGKTWFEGLHCTLKNLIFSFFQTTHVMHEFGVFCVSGHLLGIDESVFKYILK